MKRWFRFSLGQTRACFGVFDLLNIFFESLTSSRLIFFLFEATKQRKFWYNTSRKLYPDHAIASKTSALNLTGFVLPEETKTLAYVKHHEQWCILALAGRHFECPFAISITIWINASKNIVSIQEIFITTSNWNFISIKRLGKNWDNYSVFRRQKMSTGNACQKQQYYN